MKLLKEFVPYLIIFIVVVLIRTFIVTPVGVSGISMENTLKDGNIVLLKKYDKNFSRFDIIIFKHNNDKLIKRIIGLPGDYLKYENGILYINGKKVDDPFASITADFDLYYLGIEKIPEDYYFVLGDNRPKSSDSRYIGLINKKDILGSTSFSLWPLKTIQSN